MRIIRGKKALVTGAASGIGRALGLALAREGADLFLVDVDGAGLGAVAAEARSHGVEVVTRLCDLREASEISAAVAAVLAMWTRLDILVNNAGVALSGGLLDTPLEDWDWVLSINLYGVIHGCHFFVPEMVKRRSGHVVNVSSILGVMATADSIGYATAKFGVFGLSEALRAELLPLGIGVSTICPGMIATNLIKTGRLPPDKDRDKIHETFQKRNYSPDKVAKAIVGAILHDRPVVPVAPEAWALYYAKRFAPGLTAKLGRWAIDRADQVG
jgi:NAD(P)-dependent dehydrogenase (short-subunit alcohol dehydrogenase family)